MAIQLFLGRMKGLIVFVIVCAVLAEEEVRVDPVIAIEPGTPASITRRRLRLPEVVGDEEDQLLTTTESIDESDQLSLFRRKFLVKSFAFVITALISMGILIPILVAKGVIRIV